MSTSATFPTSLYTTTDEDLNSTLTQEEWQQVAVEVEAIQAALGSNSGGTQTAAGLPYVRLLADGATTAGLSLVHSNGGLFWISSGGTVFQLAPATGA